MTRTLKSLLRRMLLANAFAVSAGLLIDASLMAMHAPAAHAQNEIAYTQNPLTVQTQGAVTCVHGVSARMNRTPCASWLTATRFA